MQLIGLGAAVLAAVVADRIPSRSRRLVTAPAPIRATPGASESAVNQLSMTALVPVLAAVALARLLVSGTLGWVVALLVGASVAVRAIRRSSGSVVDGEVALAAIELLAACLSAGATPERAISVVASVSREPIASIFAAVAGSMRLGADAESAWRPAQEIPALRGLAKAVIRSADSGAPLAGLLMDAAAEARSEAESCAKAAVQRAGIKIVLPVGLCFLPAFILIGVVPVIASLLGTLV